METCFVWLGIALALPLACQFMYLKGGVTCTFQHTHGFCPHTVEPESWWKSSGNLSCILLFHQLHFLKSTLNLMCVESRNQYFGCGIQNWSPDNVNYQSLLGRRTSYIFRLCFSQCAGRFSTDNEVAQNSAKNCGQLLRISFRSQIIFLGCWKKSATSCTCVCLCKVRSPIPWVYDGFYTVYYKDIGKFQI